MKKDENDAEAETIGHYFSLLLWTLFDEGEGFSGKRPFGNSSWEHELYTALVRAGYADGTFYDDGDLDTVDRDQADTLIREALAFLIFSDLSTAKPRPKKKDHFLVALEWSDDKQMKIAEAGEILYTEEDAKQQAKTRQQELDKSQKEIIIAVQKIPSEIPNALNF